MGAQAVGRTHGSSFEDATEVIAIQSQGESKRERIARQLSYRAYVGALRGLQVQVG